jgi:hypothetical protein
MKVKTWSLSTSGLFINQSSKTTQMKVKTKRSDLLIEAFVTTGDCISRLFMTIQCHFSTIFRTQVVSSYRWNLYWMNCSVYLKGWPFKTGFCFIQMVFQACLTTEMDNIINYTSSYHGTKYDSYWTYDTKWS